MMVALTFFYVGESALQLLSSVLELRHLLLLGSNVGLGLLNEVKSWLAVADKDALNHSENVVVSLLVQVLLLNLCLVNLLELLGSGCKLVVQLYDEVEDDASLLLDSVVSFPDCLVLRQFLLFLDLLSHKSLNLEHQIGDVVDVGLHVLLSLASIDGLLLHHSFSDE